MDILLGVLVGLFILVVLVAIHELGHGIVARRNGVNVEEFGIGFPPRAWARKVKTSILGKNVLYTLNWLPLGGFVKLQGEHDADKGKGDYGAASFWAKTKILLAGVVMNWLAAVVLFTILAVVGMPKLVDGQFSVAGDTRTESSAPTVSFISPDSPADKSALKIGDEIIKVNDNKLADASELAEVTEQAKGETIEITYQREGETATTTAELRANNDDGQGFLGASAGQQTLMYSTWSAPIVGVGLTGQLTWLTFEGLGSTLVSFVSGVAQKLVPNADVQEQANQNLTKASQNVAGPVGLLGVILPNLLDAGLRYLILIAGVISLSLAALNALPIPALDGGRWFVTALYRVLKRPLTPEREEQIHGYGFMALMGLFVLITIADVGKITG
mgnify:CR=1 FL=1